MAKILIVEDDELLSESLSGWLEVEQHTVDVVADGVSAMDFLQTYKYDLIILDWQLPGLSGIEICKKHRAAGGNTGIIMLTGQKEIDQKEHGLDTGADDYVTKPCDRRELLARIRALLRRPNVHQGDILERGPVKCHTKSRKVSINGEDVKLSPLEYSILEFLLRHPNEIFSAEELVNRIWSADDEISPDSVYTNMNRLRKKIHKGQDVQLIQTVHGVGYKFVTSEER